MTPRAGRRDRIVLRSESAPIAFCGATRIR